MQPEADETELEERAWKEKLAAEMISEHEEMFGAYIPGEMLMRFIL